MTSSNSECFIPKMDKARTQLQATFYDETVKVEADLLSCLK